MHNGMVKGVAASCQEITDKVRAGAGEPQTCKAKPEWDFQGDLKDSAETVRRALQDSEGSRIAKHRQGGSLRVCHEGPT